MQEWADGIEFLTPQGQTIDTWAFPLMMISVVGLYVYCCASDIPNLKVDLSR